MCITSILCNLYKYCTTFQRLYFLLPSVKFWLYEWKHCTLFVTLDTLFKNEVSGYLWENTYIQNAKHSWNWQIKKVNKVPQTAVFCIKYIRVLLVLWKSNSIILLQKSHFEKKKGSLVVSFWHRSEMFISRCCVLFGLCAVLT